MEHVKELIDSLLSKLDGLAETKTVVGDPIEIKGKTLVPFVELSIGAGGGGFMGEGTGGGTDEKGREGKGQGQAKGGCTGGGLKITPVAVVCVDESGISAYAVGEKKGFIGKIAEMMPQIMEKIKEIKSKPK